MSWVSPNRPTRGHVICSSCSPPERNVTALRYSIKHGVIRVTNMTSFMTYPIAQYIAENTPSNASDHPCFVRSVLRMMCHRGTPVNAAASSTTYFKRVRLMPFHPRLFLSRTSCLSTFFSTGDPVGFASKRFTANGYTTLKMLKLGSAVFAMPSNVASARALFRKYGGNTNLYFGTSASSAPNSWSNLTSGTAFAALRSRASSGVSFPNKSCSDSETLSSGKTSALSAASFNDRTKPSNWYGFSRTSLGTSCRSPKREATAW
mmetsp:Transcript_6816/g.25757  ORF Transcript_6816/g.25757 Transcript_6816/m.25757 type:complete len:262 (+) Transcript_6816:155-940(+)